VPHNSSIPDWDQPHSRGGPCIPASRLPTVFNAASEVKRHGAWVVVQFIQTAPLPKPSASGIHSSEAGIAVRFRRSACNRRL